MTAPSAVAQPPTTRQVPAPSSPDGELFHYTPDEAAKWLPFSARKLREMAYRREIEHVNNGNKVTFSGACIRAISRQFTVAPLAASKRAA